MRILAALGFSVLACPSAGAQCRSWSTGLAAPSLGGSTFNDLQDVDVFDAGSGSRVYYATAPINGTQGRVYSWDRELLRVELQVGNSGVTDLTHGDDGSGPALYAAVASSWASSQVWRFDGVSWTSLGFAAGPGSLPNAVSRLAILDIGAGPRLYACGGFTTIGGTPAQHVASWNGTSWSAVGAGTPGVPEGLIAYDDGGGPQLYAGLSLPLSGSNPLVMKWDGATWSAVDPTFTGEADGMAVCDFGQGPLLAVGGAVYSGANTSGFATWNGTSWTQYVGQTTIVNDLLTADLGSGKLIYMAGYAPDKVSTFDGSTIAPLGSGLDQVAHRLALESTAGTNTLHVVGEFRMAAGDVAAGVVAYDGTTWSPLGHGFQGNVNALERADFGAGETLYAAGTLFTTGVAPLRVAARNGAGWTPLTPDPFGMGWDVLALCGVDLGSGMRLFAGGNFLSVGATSSAGIGVWNGSAWAGVGGGLHGEDQCLLAHDDGSGMRLFAGGNFAVSGGAAGNRIAAWNGTSWSAVGSGMNGIVAALARHDEGAGTMIFAGGSFTTANGAPAARIARWNGSAWSALGLGMSNGGVNALASFGGQLYAGGTFTNAGGVPVSYLARWNGTAWSDVPNSGANGAVLTLAVHDDGRGPALYVGGGFSTIGGLTAYNVARFDGVRWEDVDGGFDGPVRAFETIDDDADGDPELYAGGSFLTTATRSTGRIARLEGCPHYESFCFGDGTLADHTTPCPCANDGAPGHGCANAFDAGGALLAASGTTNPDTLVLAGSGMPLSAFGIYLQHSAQGDQVFHDGVLCAGGQLIRLRNRNAIGGSSTFPDSTDTLTVSQRGQVTPGSGALRYYSVFYRAASPTFCPPATANVTNGVRIVW